MPLVEIGWLVLTTCIVSRVASWGLGRGVYPCVLCQPDHGDILPSTQLRALSVHTLRILVFSGDGIAACVDVLVLCHR